MHPPHHAIRIAMKGWHGSEQATTGDEVDAGVALPWVEIDGVKYGAITHAEFHADKGAFNETLLTIGFLGPVSIVYLDKDGNELAVDENVKPPLDPIDSGRMLNREHDIEECDDPA